MKRILFVSEYYPPIIKGGGEINLSLIVKHLASHLKTKNHQIHVLTSKQKGLPEIEIKDNITIHRKLTTAKDPGGMLNNFIRSFIFPQSIKKETRKIKADIIHFIGTSVIAARKIKGNKFATIESYPSLCPKGDRIYQSKRVCPFRCNFIKFVNCQSYSKEIGKTRNSFWIKYNFLILAYIYFFHKKLNKSLKHVKLIAISDYLKKLLTTHKLESQILPNLIETNKFNIKQVKNKKIKIAYLGSLTKFKGPQVLAKASKNLNCHLDFYGDGTIKEELKIIIRKNKLDAKIHQPVPYEKIPEIYANSDIIVFPSIWPEPFGRITIEAGAASKPVIGSKVGAIAETINNNGLLVTPNNHEELHQALKKLILDSELRKCLGKNGARIVKDNYSPNKIIDELTRIYSL